jgi:hypothetical protein
MVVPHDGEALFAARCRESLVAIHVFAEAVQDLDDGRRLCIVRRLPAPDPDVTTVRRGDH